MSSSLSQMPMESWELFYICGNHLPFAIGANWKVVPVLSTIKHEMPRKLKLRSESKYLENTCCEPAEASGLEFPAPIFGQKGRVLLR